ncbi:MAG: iron donor protein CyaY [Phycisphaerae bacterium]|nr:iron donor protein CyaY [Phycisphaerae bacterium]
MATGSDRRFRDDGAFRRATNEVLEMLIDEIDEIEADLDPGLKPGNLQVVFEDDGSTFVLSQQTPTHEIWLSANLTAWHFFYDGQSWVERDSGEDMLSLLAGLFSAKLGEKIVFGANG